MSFNRVIIYLVFFLNIMNFAYSNDTFVLEGMMLGSKRSDVDRIMNHCGGEDYGTEDYEGILSFRTCESDDKQGLEVLINTKTDLVIFIGTWKELDSGVDIDEIKQQSLTLYGMPTEIYEDNNLWRNCYGDCVLDQYGEITTISKNGQGLLVQLGGLDSVVQLSFRLIDKVAMESLKIRN